MRVLVRKSGKRSDNRKDASVGETDEEMRRGSVHGGGEKRAGGVGLQQYKRLGTRATAPPEKSQGSLNSWYVSRGGGGEGAMDLGL